MVEHTQKEMRSSVLITGAGGYIGSLVTKALAASPEGFNTIVATDVRDIKEDQRVKGVTYLTLDIRSPELADVMKKYAIDTVVHLASIVTPAPEMTREFQYDVDVNGTRNVVERCLTQGVRKLIVTSSGAAYGYHADNPPLITEEYPLRGNQAFAYSYHKRLVEEMLADYRHKHPSLQQLIFRVGTILGETVSNQITALFEKPFVLGIKGASSPFNFVWDQDVVGCLLHGVHHENDGIYNLSGNGVLTLREIAGLLDKPYLPLSPTLLTGALETLQTVSLTQYGPEQLDFLRYRPVLSNDRLQRQFGYKLRKSTREVFALYKDAYTNTHPALFDKVRYLLPWKKSTTTTKNAVITGGASGIGRALAQRFAQEGYRIALLDVDDTALRHTARGLRHQYKTEVMTIPCDVREPQACHNAIQSVVETWGGVDVLLNNAGISHRSLLTETEISVLRKVMDVNFFGAVNCTQAALPSLCKRKGMIVAISSIAGFAPLVGRTGYAASKHALHGFFDSLREELSEEGVGVLIACPSFVKTSIEENALAGDGAQAQTVRNIVGEMASPDTIADAIFQATKQRKTLLVPSSVGKASYLLSRFFPHAYARVMRQSQGPEFGL